MAWQDRLKEAAYTSPSGVRLTFDYEDVSQQFDKKTSEFNFPDADGTYIQNLGNTSRRYPLNVIFHGADHDLSAAAFEGMLAESGDGLLEHPVYGSVTVVPFGTITRNDSVTSAGNQSIIQVTFWETTGLIYPSSQDDPVSNIVDTIDAFNDALADNLDSSLSIGTSAELVNFQNSYEQLLGTARNGLKAVADTQQSVSTAFDTIYDSINQGIDTLIGEPLNLAFQTALMIQAPARALSSIEDRLSAYGDLADAIFSTGTAVANDYDTTDTNTFYNSDLFAMSYVSGGAVIAINSTFETRESATFAAASLIDSLESITEWREGNYNALNLIDTGETHQQLQSAILQAAGYLISSSFSLKQQRQITLDRDRTFIDLVAELYGSIDNDELDFFIKSNNLTGDQILELPAGLTVSYYV